MENQSRDVQVECAENCGNSPKKELLKELTIAYAKNDMDFCLQCMRDDVTWILVGKKEIQGTTEFRETLEQLNEREVKKLTIDNIITHGNTGSVNGTILLKDNNEIAFCDVYNFGGFGKKAKIKKITSYVIPILK